MTNLSELIAAPPGGAQPWSQTQVALYKKLTQTPLPTRKTEDWRYSARYLNLGQTLPLAGTTNEGNAAEAELLVRNGRLVAQGQLPAGVSVTTFSQAGPGQSNVVEQALSHSLNLPFAWLNGAAAVDGLLIRVAANSVIEQPLRLHLQASKGLSSPRVLLIMERNASLTLVEQLTLLDEPDQTSLCTAVLDIELHDNAQLTHIKQTATTASARQILATTVRMQRDSKLLAYGLHTGTALGRHDLHVHLLGRGAECELNGVCLTQGTGHFDIHTSIEHVAPNCQSNETYRCIADDQSHLVFNGRIHIHRDAQKTSGAMSNKNLLLSSQAEIDAKPELEIYADDVKCAHGTTIGKLNPKELYYLQTRGIGYRDARQMLTLGFLLELVRAIPVEDIADRWEAWLAERLRGEA